MTINDIEEKAESYYNVDHSDLSNAEEVIDMTIEEMYNRDTYNQKEGFIEGAKWVLENINKNKS